MAMSNNVLLLLVFGLLSLMFCQSNLAALTKNKNIRDWLFEDKKTVSLLTVLTGGSTKAHRSAITKSCNYPVVWLDGGEGTLSKLAATLGQTCTDPIHHCPLQVIFVQNAHEIPLSELTEASRAFFSSGICSAKRFGGIDYKCHNVWFVLSTNFGTNNLGLEGDKFEWNLPSEESVLSEAISQMRTKWSTSISISALHVVHSSPDHDVRTEKLMKNFVEKLKLEDEEATTKCVQKETSEPGPTDEIDIEALSFARSGFVGQPWAVNAVTMALTKVRNGLKIRDGPLVFYLLGPAGTGKTMLAKAVAQAYHGGASISRLHAEYRFRLFPMAEYKSEEDIDAFVSPRPGLQGEGALIEIFTRTHRPVIVLDEIEKAHPKLFKEMLLRWIDDNDGFVQDKKNTSLHFPTSDAIFIITSNCFAKEVEIGMQRYGKDNSMEGNEMLEEISFDIKAAMENSSYGDPACLSAGKPEMWRRLSAGHALAGLSRFGFVTFVPSGTEHLDALVLRFLQKAKKRWNGSFYWTDRALTRLTSNARAEMLRNKGSGGLSVVEATLEETLLNAMSQAGQECWSNIDRRSSDRLLIEQDKSLIVRIIGCFGAPTPNGTTTATRGLFSTRTLSQRPAYYPPSTRITPNPGQDYAPEWKIDKLLATFTDFLIDWILFALKTLLFVAVTLALTFLFVYLCYLFATKAVPAMLWFVSRMGMSFIVGTVPPFIWPIIIYGVGFWLYCKYFTEHSCIGIIESTLVFLGCAILFKCFFTRRNDGAERRRNEAIN